MKKIKICSLFSGMGGFETGIFDAYGKENTEIVFASEINQSAGDAYRILYGEKPSGDITKINEKDIPDHDILVAGFPCQAFSISGKRLGFEDTRGTLFFDVARIAKEKKPKLLLLENVKGLLSHDKGRTIEVILEALNAVGYSVDFQVLNSKAFQLPQSRERIYIAAVRCVESQKWDLTDAKGQTKETKKRLQTKLNLKTFNFGFPQNNEVSKCLADIMEETVDEKYFISKERMKNAVFREKQETAEAKKGLIQIGYIGKNAQGNRLYSINGVSPTVSSQTGGLGGSGGGVFDVTARHSGNEGKRIRKITPLEAFRLQGFPDEYIEKLKKHNVSDSQLYKMAGNAVSSNVIKALMAQAKKYI